VADEPRPDGDEPRPDDDEDVEGPDSDTHRSQDAEHHAGGAPDDSADEGGAGAVDPVSWSPADAYDPEVDDLDGYETPISRFVSRSRGWIAVAIAVGLLLPAGGWAINEYAFGSAGDAVEAELGDDAALADALLLVRSTDCAGRSSSGSAFALDLDGEPVVVTNRHVVERARTIGVRPLDGGPALPVADHRLARNADVAVLELADPDDVPPRLRAGADPGEGQGGQLVLELPVAPGASGSPVLDDAGQVVGQIFARTGDGRGLATSIGALVAAARDTEPAPPC
jgi:S1-C subfamily serine protease